MDKKLILLLVGVIFMSGCIGQQEIPLSDKEKAISECRQECQRMSLIPEWDFESVRGPCLLNPIPSIQDWVCDIAHKPRQTIDDQSENQCSAFRDGRSHHFVEIDVNCELIQVW